MKQTARGLGLKKGEKAACKKFILNSNFYFKALKPSEENWFDQKIIFLLLFLVKNAKNYILNKQNEA